MGFSSSVGPAFWKCHSHPRWHFCFSQGLQADIPSLSRSRAPIVTAGFPNGRKAGQALGAPCRSLLPSSRRGRGRRAEKWPTWNHGVSQGQTWDTNLLLPDSGSDGVSTPERPPLLGQPPSHKQPLFPKTSNAETLLRKLVSQTVSPRWWPSAAGWSLTVCKILSCHLSPLPIGFYLAMP